MLPIDGQGLPLGLNVPSASPAEVQLIEPLLDGQVLNQHAPQHAPRLIYDKAGDSDALRDRLADDGIDLICPHRAGRIKPKRQDGRKLRRDKQRWKMERSIAWLTDYRRLVVRYERHPELYFAFAQLACVHLLNKRLSAL